MAEVVQEKSRGLKFAEQQLLRHGWEHGKGLGRAENGISEAIKVKVKCDKGGVGHKEGEQFTFHWWDHVFNKASSSLQVESDQDGIKLKRTAEEDGEEGMISNKKPRSAALAKAKLYGSFVKSATLLSGQEQPVPKSSSSDDSSSSDEEDQRLDLSSSTKLSDVDLMKACGGRTAHKGARHGLKMSAKLARLEQQEAEFMAKYGGKSRSASASPTAATSQSERQEETTNCRRTKPQKKRSSKSFNDRNNDEVSESPETEVQPKKKKKKLDEGGAEGDLICVEKPKKKKKKNRDERPNSPTAERESPEVELHSDAALKKKKKKKKLSKQHSSPADEESNDNESSQSDDRIPEEAEKSTEQRKRKKCKKDKPCGDADEDALPPKKKKPKH